jgi:hypothetical protein
MGLHLGDIAPNFQAETTEGFIDFHGLQLQEVGDFHH